MKTIFSLYETYKGSLIKFMLVFLVLLGLMLSFTYFNRAVGLHDDNTIEEALELDFALFTGFDVDVTPHSPEN